MIPFLLASLLAVATPTADAGPDSTATVPRSAPAPGPDSATAVARSPLVALSFLVGDWDASGGGAPGASAGTFSFEWAAGARAMLRRNQSDTPGQHHEDVLLVYPAGQGATRAVYVDNEGHTIEYAVTMTPGAVVLESAGPGPRYRLAYRLLPDSTLSTTFEVAPPGGAFRTYLQGTARRR